MIAFASDVTIALGVIAFFAFLALLTFMRLLLRKQPPTWRAIRMGFFVERRPREEDDDPQGDR